MLLLLKWAVAKITLNSLGAWHGGLAQKCHTHPVRRLRPPPLPLQQEEKTGYFCRELNRNLRFWFHSPGIRRFGSRCDMPRYLTWMPLLGSASSRSTWDYAKHNQWKSSAVEEVDSNRKVCLAIYEDRKTSPNHPNRPPFTRATPYPTTTHVAHCEKFTWRKRLHNNNNKSL